MTNYETKIPCSAFDYGCPADCLRCLQCDSHYHNDITARETW